jgi:hypothetical protein
MIEPKTHTIEQPGASREEVFSHPAADDKLPSLPETSPHDAVSSTALIHSPPATRINSPLIQRESSEARNTAGRATSSGSPMRPNGVSST